MRVTLTPIEEPRRKATLTPVEEPQAKKVTLTPMPREALPGGFPTGPSPEVVGVHGGTPGPTPAELENLAQLGKGIAADVAGVATKAGAALIKGTTFKAIDPERGEVGIPFTSMRRQVAPPLGEALEDVVGVSPEIAQNPYIGLGPEFLGMMAPWSRVAKTVAALRPPGAAAGVPGRVAESVATGGIVGAAEVRQDDETMLENALGYAVGAGVLHLSFEAAIPVANYLKHAAKYKTVTRDLTAEDVHRALTGREGASPEAVNFVKGLNNKGERAEIAKEVIKGEGVRVKTVEPRFGGRRAPEVPPEPPARPPEPPTRPVEAPGEGIVPSRAVEPRRAVLTPIEGEPGVAAPPVAPPAEIPPVEPPIPARPEARIGEEVDKPGVFKLNRFVGDVDYVDAETESFIQAMYKELGTDSIYATTGTKYHGDPTYELFWMR